MSTTAIWFLSAWSFFALPATDASAWTELGPIAADTDWLFEIKWDGTRSLAFVDTGEFRLINRNRNPVRDRYPELAGISGLPPGTIVDGEITVLEGGRPSFAGRPVEEVTCSPLAKA